MLHHLTLNTGHLAVTPRTEVTDHVVARLLPVIDAEGGAVPGMPGWHLDFFFPLDTRGARSAGAGFFQISDEPGTSQRPVVMAVACWRAEFVATAWRHASVGYLQMETPLRAIGLWRDPYAVAPPLPWLAIWLTPFITLADAETTRTFGDLERCVAWALFDA